MTEPAAPAVSAVPAVPRGPLRRIGRALIADPKHGPLPALLLVLTVVTGVVDAVSILSLGRVFVANMTGNVVFVGFALAGAPGFSLSASASALAGFLIGAAIGGALAGRLGSNRGRLLRAGVGLEFGLVAVALVVASAAGSPFGAAAQDVLAALLAVAMGAQNAVVRRLAVPDLTTTVLTMTLTGLAADSRLAGGDGAGSTRRVFAVGTMLVGALVGALELKTSIVLPLATATVLAAVTAALYVPAARREAGRSTS
jgi:uncharacterized membrane protein YoaK (UPF0700 family)